MKQEYEKKTGKEAYETWKMRLDNTLRWIQSDHPNGHKAWRQAYKLTYGDHWSQWAERSDVAADNPNDLITVNVIGSTVNQFLPFLVKNFQKFITKPTRPEEVVSAMLQEQVINYDWRRYKMQKQIRRATLDALICGHGICKTGYNLELNESATPDKDGNLEYRDYIEQDAPYIKRVSPFLFLFDPEAPEHDLESARWCAEILFESISNVKANKLFDGPGMDEINKGKMPDLVSSFIRESVGKNYMGPDDEFERVVLIEVWDKKFRKVMTFAKGIEAPIREISWPFIGQDGRPYLDGFPYVMLPYVETPNDHYPTGLVKWAKDQQFELDRNRTRMFAHGRRAKRIIEVEDSVDKGEFNNMLRGEDDTAVRVSHLGSIGLVPDATAPRDWAEIEGIIRQDIREMTGADELLRGGNLADRTSATEVNARTSFLNLKIEDKAARVDEFTVELARQVLRHTKENMEEPRVIEIAGSMGGYWGEVTGQAPGPDGKYWHKFSASDVRGDFDLELESTSQSRTDPAAERANQVQMFQLIAPQLMQIKQIAQQEGGDFKVMDYLRMVFDSVYNHRQDLGRIIPAMNTVQAPIQTQTEFDQAQQPQPVPTQPAGVPPQQQQIQAQAVNPMSGVMGGLNGGQTNGGGMMNGGQ